MKTEIVHNWLVVQNKSPFILFFLISAIITSGAVLTKSFWGDEIFSIQFATLTGHAFINALAKDYHPPFYFIILKLWIYAFGSGEFTLRIFQFIIGFIFISSVYFTFIKIYPKRIHPLFILFLFSGELWLFIPMLRYYSLAATIVVFSTLIFFNWITSKRQKDFYLLTLIYIILLYTDYPSSVIILIHFIYLLIKERKLIFKHLISIIASIIAFSPWLVILYLQLGKLLNRDQVADLNASPFSIALKVLYSIYAFLFSETIFPFEIIFIVGVIILLIVFFIGTKLSSLFKKNNVYLFFSVITIVIGIIFTSLSTTFISRHTSFIYTPSRTFFVLPFVFILLSFFYDNLKSSNWRKIFIITFLILNLYSIFNILSNRHFLMPVYASPWKEIFNELKSKEGVILADEGNVYKYYANHLSGKFPEAINPKTKSGFIKILNGREINTFYLLLLGRESTEPTINEDIISFVFENFKKVNEEKYLPIEESYQKIKSFILKRKSYDAKFTLIKFSVPKKMF